MASSHPCCASRQCASSFWPLAFISFSSLFTPALTSRFSPKCSSPIQSFSQSALQSSSYHPQDSCHSMSWTHDPFCISDRTRETYCIYTNAEFANGRGISFITSPEVAASLTLRGRDRPGLSPVGGITESSNIWPAYEARHVSGRGVGLYSNRSIKAGEIIMLESPVLVVMRDALEKLSRDERHVFQDRALEQVPDRSKELFLDLAVSRGGDVVDDIIQTNAIRQSYTGNGGDEIGHLAVVPEAAVDLWGNGEVDLICASSFYRFNESTLQLEVYALKHIEAGEELTFSYGYSEQPHASRQQSLNRHWSFDCNCTLCRSDTASISASDARLERMAELKSLLPEATSDLQKLVDLMTELLELYEKERLIIEKSQYEEILAYTWAQLADEQKARYWAGRASTGWKIVAGVGSWEVKRVESLLNDIKGHPSWGRRRQS